MFQSSLLLAKRFLFNLLFSFYLSLLEVPLSPVLRVLLLVLDHLLQRAILQVLLLLLQHQEILLLLLLHLNIIHFSLHLILKTLLIILEVVLRLFLVRFVLSYPELFLVVLLSLPVHLIFLSLQVPLLLRHDVLGPLLRLVDLLPRLLFFLFQQ